MVIHCLKMFSLKKSFYMIPECQSQILLCLDLVVQLNGAAILITLSRYSEDIQFVILSQINKKIFSSVRDISVFHIMEQR